MDEAAPEFPAEAFARLDEGDDAQFYQPVRLVTHIDDGAIAALRAFYGTELSAGGDILDLMSSWVSHLPDELLLGEVIGHGMNAEELAKNPRLTRWFVQNLNADPLLQMPDASLDAVLCCVSVQYLQKLVDVFAEVRRVLRPGAPCIVSFSNRCFWTKAVAIWRSLGLQDHVRLVHLYLHRAGFSDIAVHVLQGELRGDPLIAVVGRA